MTNKPRFLIFASGSKCGGGSGARLLLEKVESGELHGECVGIVTNRPYCEEGGIAKMAMDLGFEKGNKDKGLYILDYLPKREADKTYSIESLEKIFEIHEAIFNESEADFVFMSGGLWEVHGIPFNKIVNIHPGSTTSGYGGFNMFGNNVQKKVFEDFQVGLINRSCVTMHYATDKYDDPRFTIAQVPVLLEGEFHLGECNQEQSCQTWEEVKARVNATEKHIQWQITDAVLTGLVKWSGEESDNVRLEEEQIQSKYDLPEATGFLRSISLKV